MLPIELQSDGELLLALLQYFEDRAGVCYLKAQRVAKNANRKYREARFLHEVVLELLARDDTQLKRMRP
jgi:hypothetical protein